ncbi:raffinose synthase or seed imbibition protein Sip1-domain-containing protein [Aspergillus varians]
MAVQVTSYPPLGQVTCLKHEKVRFTVLVESDPPKEWEVQIWHNIGVSEWSALPLQDCPPTTVLSLTSSGQDSSTRHVFEAEVPRPQSGSANFTIRYRESQNADAEWQWANREQQLGDGELIFTFDLSSDLLTAPSAEGFARYFDNLSPEIEVGARKSEAPGAALWNLSGVLEGAKDGDSGVVRLPLGVPSSVSRFFALVRVSTPWLGPRQGKDKLELKEDAVLCSFLRKDGVHVVLLGVSIDHVLTVLVSGTDGEVVVKSQNDSSSSSRFQVLAAAADGFEIAMSALIYEARKIVRPYGIATEVDDPKAQWLSNWYDGLTYCTWNGIGQDLNEEKIVSALDDLKAQGIVIKGLIIDDNWQSLDNEGAGSWHRGWTQFEANPKAFPQGLAKTVSTIREQHPNIEYIAVWHALLGYWGGISPDGELAATYKTKEVQLNSATRKSILAIDPDDIQRFYNDFYDFLSSAGITGVKTDAQSFLDLLRDPDDRRRFTTSYQDAWAISSLRHFGPKVISCMSQFPQPIFHSQLPTNKPTIVARNSDDFSPDSESSHHTWHVFCNAHNALLTRYLNVLPDWDIFQTTHPYASFHAAARCISGGPISITDTPHHHNKALIKQLTAPTIQGKTITLRPSVVGRTRDMYQDINEGHVLRVGTYHGSARTGSGIMALFNVSSSASKSSVLIPVADFPGVYSDSDGTERSYIVRAHTTGKIADGLYASSAISVTLHKAGWEILTAYPTHSFTLKGEMNMEVAVLGLLGKMTGVAALVNVDVYLESNGRLRVDVAVKALGVLGIYFSRLQEWNIDEHFMVVISGKPVPRKAVWKEDGRVLAVDVEEAWKAMGLETGWSNEVRVSVLL